MLRVAVDGSAGQPRKHRLLRELSVVSCCSSRGGAAFARGAMRQLCSSRVHSVCNSLIGDFVAVSLALLGVGGSLQELGKRAAWSKERSEATAAAHSSVMDMAADSGGDVGWFNGLLWKLAAHLRSRVVHGLPSTVFTIGRVHDAFQLLKSGGNVGKVVVTSPFSTLVHVDLRADVGEAARQPGVTRVARQSAVSVQAVCRMVEGIAGRSVAVDAPLMEAGVDSLGAVELRNQLQRATGGDVPSTLMFDHPTARQLAAAVECCTVSCGRPVEARPRRLDESKSCGGEAAVEGSSALLPGGVGSLCAVWHVSASGGDVVGTAPAARWDVSAVADVDEALWRQAGHGGFMLGAELADNAAFAVSPAEAAAMDPCQRLLLERGYAALHAAALGRAALSGSATGVFLGFAGTEFSQVLAASPAGRSVYAATGATCSIASGRLSYVLGLHGPCVTYDTACSAALAACHGGLRALQLGECARGLVAGVNLVVGPGVGISFAISGMTSARGR